MNNLQKRINRKAWKEISNIQKAHNFLTIEGAINDAVLKTFSLWDCGMQRIIAREQGAEALKRYERVNELREKLTIIHKPIIKAYLIKFINPRFKSCAMYQQFIKSCPVS